jgi:hypothetical protein
MEQMVPMALTVPMAQLARKVHKALPERMVLMALMEPLVRKGTKGTKGMPGIRLLTLQPILRKIPLLVLLPIPMK